MRALVAHIGRPAIKSRTAHVFQPPPPGKLRRRFVKINRHAEAPPDFFSGTIGEGDAFFHGRSVERNKRNYIGRPDPRMHAPVRGQIDQFGRAPGTADGAFQHRFGGAGKRHHAAVVINIGLPAEQQHARAGDGLDDGAYLRLIAAFGKVGNAFDHWLEGAGRIACTIIRIAPGKTQGWMPEPPAARYQRYQRAWSRMELARRLLTTASNPLDMTSSQRLLDNGEMRRM